MIKKCEVSRLNGEITIALCDDTRVQIGTGHIDNGYAYIRRVNESYYISNAAEYDKQELEKKEKLARGNKKSVVVLDKEG